MNDAQFTVVCMVTEQPFPAVNEQFTLLSLRSVYYGKWLLSGRCRQDPARVMERERRAFEFRLSELKGEKEAAEQARDYALKHTVRHDGGAVYAAYLSSRAKLSHPRIMWM